MTISNKASLALVGSGGVGTIASVALQKSGSFTVTSVIRSDYSIVKEKGFDISSIDHGDLKGWRPDFIASSIQDAAEQANGRPIDYVVVTMKALPDIYSTAKLIKPLITLKHTVIVLIQNGYGIEIPIVEAFPGNTILSCISMIAATNYQGKIIHNQPDNLQVGVYPNGRTDNLNEQQEQADYFIKAYKAGGAGSCVFCKDTEFARWRKLIWNSSFNTICALTQIADSYIVQDDEARENLLRPIMKEVAATAAASGHKLPDDIDDFMISTVDFNDPYKPSMLVDVNKGNPIEFEVIVGNPLRKAQELNVDTPKLKVIYEALRLVQKKILLDAATKKSKN